MHDDDRRANIYDIFTNGVMKRFSPHLTSDVLFQKKISTTNQGVHQKLKPSELRLVKTRKNRTTGLRDIVV